MNTPSLWLLTKKNLKILIRAKSSALIVIFAPLLLILILGLSYNTSDQYGLNIGVYSSSFTEDVNSFIKTLQEEEFKIVKYDTSLDDCIADIKEGFVHTCISVPETFKIEGNEAKEVTFYIDPTRINIVWMIQDTLQKKLNFKSEQLSEQLAQDTLSKLLNAKNTIATEKEKLSLLGGQISSAASSATSTKSDLAGLNLTAPQEGDTTTTLSNVSTEVDSSLEEIETALEIVDNSELNSSDKADIKSTLNDAKDEITILQQSLTNGSFSSLINDFESARNQINDASSAVGSATTTLDSVSGNLNAISNSLTELQTSLTAVQTSLEEQKVTEAGTLAKPLITKIEPISKEGTYLNYTFPTLLILVIMFTSLLLGTTLVMMEKHSPAFLRNYFLPIRKITFVGSIYLTNLILTLIQVVIILGISLIFLKESYMSMPAVALILFIASSVFTFLGMAIGYVFTSEETGLLATISLGSLLLFISGVVLPVESLSPWLRQLAFLNPFVISEKLVRNIFIFGASFKSMWIDLAILVGYVVLLFVIIMIIEIFMHKHFVETFMRHHHKAHRENDKKNKNEA